MERTARPGNWQKSRRMLKADGREGAPHLKGEPIGFECVRHRARLVGTRASNRGAKREVPPPIESQEQHHQAWISRRFGVPGHARGRRKEPRHQDVTHEKRGTRVARTKRGLQLTYHIAVPFRP